MGMKPCIHLDYDNNYPDCELMDYAPHYPCVKYWHRNNPPYAGAPVNIQFCKKLGRINGIFDCYNKSGMWCYEPEV